MNIKFKMPKFQRHLTNKAMWKELLLTFLGTTISIVLTFGTAHLLDVRQRVKDRKMSALMVTGNVERFARVLDDLADELMQRDTISAWLLGLPLDSLETVPHHQLLDAVNAVISMTAWDRVLPRLTNARSRTTILSPAQPSIWTGLSGIRMSCRVTTCA